MEKYIRAYFFPYSIYWFYKQKLIQREVAIFSLVFFILISFPYYYRDWYSGYFYTTILFILGFNPVYERIGMKEPEKILGTNFGFIFFNVLPLLTFISGYIYLVYFNKQTCVPQMIDFSDKIGRHCISVRAYECFILIHICWYIFVITIYRKIKYKNETSSSL